MTDKNRNLIIRVVTAFVLLPLVLWLIALGGVWFALLIGVAAGLCAVELNLLPSSRGSPRCCAQRPFPSMMIPTWRGRGRWATSAFNCWTSRSMRGTAAHISRQPELRRAGEIGLP